MTACKGSKQIHVKKQIHQGSASSQGKRKNTYQLWKFMNIRCSGYINAAEFLNGCIRGYFFHHANYGNFRQLRLISIRPALNQTQRCSAVRSHLFELERERGMKVECVNLRLRVSLFKQWGLVTSKTTILLPHRSYFTNWSFRAVCSLRDLSDICVQ